MTTSLIIRYLGLTKDIESLEFNTEITKRTENLRYHKTSDLATSFLHENLDLNGEDWCRRLPSIRNAKMIICNTKKRINKAEKIEDSIYNLDKSLGNILYYL